MSYVAGGYAVFNQLKSLKQAKDDLYEELTPEQKLQWNKIFGSPGGARVPVPQITPAYQAPVAGPVSDLDKLNSGI